MSSPKQVSLIAAFRDGKLLLGKRRDNSRWTLPGGHANPGESPEKCAVRELFEETHLKPKSLTQLDERQLGGTTITTFRAQCPDGDPTPDHDPDDEVLFWRWVDISAGVPKDVAENCQGPRDTDKNVLLDLFGFQKSEHTMEELEGLQKAFSREEFQAHIASIKAREAKVRAHIQQLAQSGVQAHVFNFPKQPGRQSMVHRDTYPMNLGAEGWRVSHFQDGEPMGHQVAPSQEEALLDAHRAGADVFQPVPQDQWKSEHTDGLGEDLSKTMPGPRFPRLGLPDDRRETPIVSTAQELATKRHNIASRGAHEIERPIPVQHRSNSEFKRVHAHLVANQAGDAGGASIVPGDPTAVSYSTHESLRDQTGGLGDLVNLHRNAPVATREHENLHLMMNRVQALHGRAGRQELARRIVAHLAPEEHNTLAAFMRDRYPGVGPEHPLHNEEKLAILLNYLNSPGEREAYHRYRHHTPVRIREFGNAMKRAHRQVQEAGQLADESWTRAPEVHQQPVDQPMVKMAIQDIPKGQRLAGAPSDLEEREYDYSHVLPAHLKGEYRILMGAGGGAFGAKVLHIPTGKLVGVTEAHENSPHSGSMYFETSDLDSEHQGKGVGKAMYEATLAHGYHTGHREVRGGAHSEDAHRVHEALARKHGLEYRPRQDLDGMVDELHPHAPYQHVLKGELSKQETQEAFERDEVSRLLHHPNAQERTMALKLHGVQPHHLGAALRHQDPAVRRQALEHPGVNHEALMALMESDLDPGLQVEALQHPGVSAQHLQALYLNHQTSPQWSREVLHALANHHLLDGAMIDQMVQDGHGMRVIDNLKTPRHVLERVVEAHLLDPQDDAKRALARRAVRHPAQDPQLVARAFRETPHQDVKIAAAQGPHFPNDEAMQVLQRGRLGTHEHESFLRSMIVSAKGVSRRHLQEATQDRNPVVQQAARERLQAPVHKFEQELQGWLSQAAPEVLHKASRAALEGPDNRGVLEAQAGHNAALEASLEAAGWLAGQAERPPQERIRAALLDADEDPDLAALLAHGLEGTPANLKALKGFKNLQPKGERISKAEEETKAEHQDLDPNTEVVAPDPDGRETAEKVQQAFRSGFVVPVELGGRHSHRTLLVRDNDSGASWLLKPNSGGTSPASGESEQPASSARREAAWWHLAAAWGLQDAAPRVDLLLVGGHEVAAIRLLPWRYRTLDKLRDQDANNLQRILKPYLETGVLHRWAALDFITGNADRNLNNSMSPESPGPGDHVKLIDHGAAFAGQHFDPAHDQASFVPGYLRAWAPPQWRQLAPEQRLKALPRLGRQEEESLRGWILNLHAEDIERVLYRYAVYPQATVDRLARLKAQLELEPADLAVLKCWVTP